MTLAGYGPYQIATQFTAGHIPIPAYHGRHCREVFSRLLPLLSTVCMSTSFICACSSSKAVSIHSLPVLFLLFL